MTCCYLINIRWNLQNDPHVIKQTVLLQICLYNCCKGRSWIRLSSQMQYQTLLSLLLNAYKLQWSFCWVANHFERYFTSLLIVCSNVAVCVPLTFAEENQWEKEEVRWHCEFTNNCLHVSCRCIEKELWINFQWVLLHPWVVTEHRINCIDKSIKEDGTYMWCLMGNGSDASFGRFTLRSACTSVPSHQQLYCL